MIMSSPLSMMAKKGTAATVAVVIAAAALCLPVDVAGFGANCPLESSRAIVSSLRSCAASTSSCLSPAAAFPLPPLVAPTTTIDALAPLDDYEDDGDDDDEAPGAWRDGLLNKDTKKRKKKKDKGGPKRKGKKRKKRRDNADLKVAFVGDQGLGRDPTLVLELIDDWGAELLVQLGDFDYADDPRAYSNLLANLPIPMLAVVGNHDILKWFSPDGYRDRLSSRLASHSGVSCKGEFGVAMVCVWHELVFVLSGVGTLGTAHAQFIDDTLSSYPDARWKFCVWHKNQKAYQTGDKEDETGYDVYEVCRRHGAVIATSHEHSYERTHLMSSFEHKVIANTSDHLLVEPGRTFAFVSGLGGKSIRPWVDNANANPWWAAAASLSNRANYGALLCKFNKGGIVGHASCRFQDISGKVFDDFTITSKTHKSGADGATNSPPPPPPPKTKFFELPVTSPLDIITHDPSTGTLTCGPERLRFAGRVSKASSSTPPATPTHYIRFSKQSYIHDSVLDQSLLDQIPSQSRRILQARIQVMGAAATDAAHFHGRSSHQEEELPPIDSIEIVAVTDIDMIRVLASSACANDVVGSPTLMMQQDADDRQSVPRPEAAFDDPFKRDHHQAERVIIWDQDGEDWEPGEVWVSSDISKTVHDGFAASHAAAAPSSNTSASVWIAIRGWTVGDAERAVFGVDATLSTCVSPSLILTLST